MLLDCYWRRVSGLVCGVVLGGVLMSALPASAAVFLIDHNTAEDDVSTATGPGPGGVWNRYAAPTNVNGSAIVDATGALTAITYNKTGTIADSSNAGTSAIFDNVANPNPSWATSSTDNRSSGDYFFTNTGASADSFTVTFSGLTSGQSISLDVLASRNTGSPRGFYEWSVDGGTTWKGFTVLNSDGTVATATPWNNSDTQATVFHNVNDGYTAHRYMNTSNQTLVGSTVSVRVTDEAVSGNYSVINAIRLTVVPEPGSAVLVLAASLLGLAARRRR